MSEQIKFKAWDKIQQRFRDDVVITPSGKPYILRTSPEINKAITEAYKKMGAVLPEGSYFEVDFSDWYAIENIEIRPA